ncbi:MAG: hypothetical protein DMG07_26270 [Acidobacteria bacterium]|nr:MAG: hypothetical protein DMG07_26270 [Acidobacteriota bacterium]
MSSSGSVVTIKRAAPASGRAKGTQPPAAGSAVVVVFAAVPDSQARIEGAIARAKDLGGPLRVIVVQEVPTALALDAPPVSNEFIIRKLLEVLAPSGVESKVEVLLCRDGREAIRSALASPALVVLVADGRGWLSRGMRLLRLLVRDGHCVALLDGA